MTTATRPRVAELPSISAADFDADSSGRSRIETKYLTDAEFAEGLPGLLPAGSRVLEVEGRTRFAFHTVYFDTPKLLSYRTSTLDINPRFLVRTRANIDTGQAVLEVEVWGDRGLIERAASTRGLDQLEHLSASDMRFINAVLRRGKVDPRLARNLSPYLAAGYRRSTYVTPAMFGSTVTTVDTDLYWEQLRPEEPGGELAVEQRPECAFVEVSNHFVANSVNHLMWRYGMNPQPLSKYGVGTTLLDPRLPNRRWHRGLRAVLDLAGSGGTGNVGFRNELRESSLAAS
ncbi:VTC domain-containing protein [Actinomyces minihominis]|uniref:VTC domain-containing protein n=1 Tax=Actinomyces minihominis TaxID=2002838 RepID=UPI000C07CCC0|nr:VTC domain-containing protein [Actinomyces minihominis]